MKAPLCVLPILLAAPAFCAEESDLLNVLPANSQIVIGARVRAVVDSPIGQNAIAEIQASQPDFQKLIALAGFNPLRDVDEVIVATTGEGTTPPTLAVVRGNFDVAHLAQNAETYHGVPILNQNKPNGVLAYPDASTLFAGDLESVKAAIDRRGSPSQVPAALADRIAEHRSHYDVWGVLNNVSGLSSQMPPSAKASGLDSIDRVQFGLSLRKGLEMVAEVHARTPKDAEQLAATMQLLEGFIRQSQPVSSGSTFNVKNNNGTLKIAIAVSEEDLKKAADAQRKGGRVRATPRPSGPVAVQSPETHMPAPETKPVPAQPSRTVAPGSMSSTDGGTAVFTLPSRP